VNAVSFRGLSLIDSKICFQDDPFFVLPKQFSMSY
jgi:hypothetical protein